MQPPFHLTGLHRDISTLYGASSWNPPVYDPADDEEECNKEGCDSTQAAEFPPIQECTQKDKI